MNPLLK